MIKATLCECGCGQEIPVYKSVHKKFILGHNRRGIKHTNETKMKINDTTKGRFTGDKSHNWKGGISFEPYCPKFNNTFKESIREKFGRVCFLCGAPENGRKLDVHHVNYDKSCLCSEIECEFVPLCRSCHSKTSNGDRDYWENTIIERLEMFI